MGSFRIFRYIALLVMLTAWAAIGKQNTREDWRRADEATVRLRPEAFSDLPPKVRAELEHRGCTIPQAYNAAGHKQNVIQGEFTAAGQTDWSVLCSHEKHSSILVFRDGQPDQLDSFAEEPDSQYLQVVGSGSEIGYSRLVSVVTPSVMRRRSPKGRLRAADHDGIENIFLGKASVVWYQSGGRWIQTAWSD